MKIKPENIYSTNIIRNNPGSFMLKFVDFKSMEIIGTQKHLFGTQSYMYPPLCRHETGHEKGIRVDEKVDIYSFFAFIADIEYGQESIKVLSKCYSFVNLYNKIPSCSHRDIVNNVFKGYLSTLKNIDIYDGVKNKELFDSIVEKRNHCDSLICLILKYFMWEECMKDEYCNYDDETVFKELQKVYDFLTFNGFDENETIYQEVPQENIYDTIPENIYQNLDGLYDNNVTEIKII